MEPTTYERHRMSDAITYTLLVVNLLFSCFLFFLRNGDRDRARLSYTFNNNKSRGSIVPRGGANEIRDRYNGQDDFRFYNEYVSLQPDEGRCASTSRTDNLAMCTSRPTVPPPHRWRQFRAVASRAYARARFPLRRSARSRSVSR